MNADGFGAGDATSVLLRFLPGALSLPSVGGALTITRRPGPRSSSSSTLCIVSGRGFPVPHKLQVEANRVSANHTNPCTAEQVCAISLTWQYYACSQARSAAAVTNGHTCWSQLWLFSLAPAEAPSQQLCQPTHRKAKRIHEPSVSLIQPYIRPKPRCIIHRVCKCQRLSATVMTVMTRLTWILNVLQVK